MKKFYNLKIFIFLILCLAPLVVMGQVLDVSDWENTKLQLLGKPVGTIVKYNGNCYGIGTAATFNNTWLTLTTPNNWQMYEVGYPETCPPEGPSVTGVTVTPPSVTIVKNAPDENLRKQTFSATVNGTGLTGADQNVNWTLDGTPLSSLNGNVLTVAQNETAASITVRATSQTDPNKSGTATVSIVQMSVNINVNPSNYTLNQGGSTNFTANVTPYHGAPTNVIWTVEGNVSENTIISTAGVLTVGENETAPSITVVATGFENARGTAQVNILITAPAVLSVAVSPKTTTVTVGETETFTASVNQINGAPTNVTWSILEPVASGTNINGGGVLTISPNETATGIRVVAASAAQGFANIKDTAYVTVTIPAVSYITVSPNNEDNGDIVVIKGDQIQFAAEVFPINQAVEWSIYSYTGTSNINQTGLLTVAENETRPNLGIRASAGGKYKQVTVNISKGTVSGIQITNKEVALIKGETYLFEYDIDAYPESAKDSVYWSVITNNAKSDIDSKTGLFTLAQTEEFDEILVEVKSTIDPNKKDTAAIINSKIKSVTISPKTKTIAQNQNVQFEVTVENTGKYTDEVEWNIVNSSSVKAGTSVNNNGLLTIAADETAHLIEVEVRSTQISNKFDRATVTITANIPVFSITGVTISPQNAVILKGGTQNFTANIVLVNEECKENADDGNIEWNLVEGDYAAGTTLGNITQTGAKLTIASDEDADEIKVKVSAKKDPSKFAVATITVKKVKSVTVSPNPASVAAGGELQFTAVVDAKGGADETVIWRKFGGLNSTGMNPLSGKLTVSSGETASSVKVIATSDFDESIADTVEVIITKKSVEPSTGISVAKERGDFGILLYQNIVNVADKPEFEVLTPEPANVSVVIYDNQGNLLYSEKGKTFRDGNVNSFKTSWDLTNRNGRKVASGTYIIQATAKSAAGSRIYQYFISIGVKK